MGRFIVTRGVLGICHSQLCAEKDATKEEIEKAANTLNPSGTQNGWHIAAKEGVENPVVCASNPNRLHWLLVC